MTRLKIANKRTAKEHFPCSNCGAVLKFVPGTDALACEYCGIENQIPTHKVIIQEYDLQKALEKLESIDTEPLNIKVHCNECGAGFQFENSIHSGECPFCGTPIVKQNNSKAIQPKSLLPFIIDSSTAKHYFQLWIKGLWFAPNAVKKYVRSETKLTGVYLPHWTFDSDTMTDYSGMRGDTYYVNQAVQISHKGRIHTRMKRVPKISWTPVRGRVGRFFDDVLIGASLSLPRKILDALQPWDLNRLIPYDEQYLSGFSSEIYQIEIDQGFDYAKQCMDNVIHQDISFDIGGDHQRIHQVHTRHSNCTYKHCLLPVWLAAFDYRGKTFRFAINGCTGEVQGERPFSWWKIGFTVLSILLMIAGGYYYLESSGLLRNY